MTCFHCGSVAASPTGYCLSCGRAVGLRARYLATDETVRLPVLSDTTLAYGIPAVPYDAPAQPYNPAAGHHGSVAAVHPAPSHHGGFSSPYYLPPGRPQSTGTAFSIAAMALAIVTLLVPPFLGLASIICAVAALKRGERLATVSLILSLIGTAGGFLFRLLSPY